MPRKIGFTVVYATSEEDRHSSLELNVHGPTVRGWQSGRRCCYPQELILRLHKPATLSRIQVLAHQYLIPEKLEIWTSHESNGTNSTDFSYLGYITLADNASTLYKSRELKSVALPETAAATLKLKLHKPHNNSHNIHEQVGLIAINILGESYDQEYSGEGDAPYNPHYTSPYDDLAFEMYVDREVAKIIRQMEMKKLQAVEEERFEYASKLKIAMENLRKAGERLGKYELEKKYAIALEDYDKAKAKKAQAQDYRQQVYQSLEIDDLLELHGPLEKNDASMTEGKEPLITDTVIASATVAVPIEDLTSPPRLVVPPSRDGALSPTGPIHQQPPSPLHQKPNSPGLVGTEVTDHSTSGVLERQNGCNRGSLRRKTKSAGPTLRSSYEAYEERTIPALRHSHTNEFTRECHMENTESKISSKLNDREKKQAALPISIFGMEMVEKFYSKQFTDKEEGLMQLKDELRTFDTEVSKHPANKTARAAILLLHRALRDKVFSVYSLAAQLIRVFFTEFAVGRVSSAEIARSVDRLLPELLTKSGDTTPRIHNMAVHTILSMVDCKCVRELHIIPVHLSRPVNSSTHQRLALSRLEMVEQLILNHGISTDKQSGLTCRTLSELGLSGLHHPAEAVRKVSERILVLVYKVNPRLVRKQLPPDDDITRRNLLYRHLFLEFDLIDLQRKKDLETSTKSTTPVHSKIVENNEASIAKSPPRSSPVVSTSSSVSITSPSENSGDHKGDKMCIFCLSKGQVYSEEGLNVHYWRSCPMLTRCEACKQVVEVSYVNLHLLNECDMRNNYVKCDTCKQAVHTEGLKQHSKSDHCSKPLEGCERCPLCHLHINRNKWRDHLMGEQPCTNNLRNKMNKNCSKSPSNAQNLGGKLTSPTGRDY